jgi:hypothetical protein
VSIDISMQLAAANQPGLSRLSGASSKAQAAPPLENAWNVGGALKTAKSAYSNERFATMLEQITDPRSSLAVALMRAEAGQGVDLRYAQAQYAENS